jgi:2-polyprenyl-3-methyl-5-hydroxy-6-metoxy-1,4-benzoquinol methylase
MKTQSVKVDRWKKAQQYEKKFWENQADQTSKEGEDRFRWYKQRSDLVIERVEAYLKGFDTITALEIGSGPIGLINYLRADERYALDPLEDFNQTIPEIVKARDPEVQYRQGTGETVSSLKKTFNFIILDNVLDHCQDPVKVLAEIYKNLEKSGVLFFSINIYTPFGVMVRNAMEIFEIDKGHPFNFTEKSIRSMLTGAGFKIISPKTSDYKIQRRHYIRSSNYKHKLKGYLGLTDVRFSAICIKP